MIARGFSSPNSFNCGAYQVTRESNLWLKSAEIPHSTREGASVECAARLQRFSVPSRVGQMLVLQCVPSPLKAGRGNTAAKISGSSRSAILDPDALRPGSLMKPHTSIHSLRLRGQVPELLILQGSAFCSPLHSSLHFPQHRTLGRFVSKSLSWVKTVSWGGHLWGSAVEWSGDGKMQGFLTPRAEKLSQQDPS